MSSVSESVRRMLSKYTFEVENSELACILCKKIMIDAYQSFCGCNYCQGCITNYLSGENKYCVGDNEECKEGYLILDKNVVINPRINNLILKLKVRCPNQSCTFETELSQLENHLQTCIERHISCPFISLGCTNERGSEIEVINHLQQGEWIHANMLSEFVKNTKNEIIYLKEESIKKEIQMKNIIDEILTLKKFFIKKEELIESQRKDLENMKEELRRERENMENKEMMIMEMKRQMEEQRTKIDGLNNDAVKRKREMEVMRGDLRKMIEKKTIIKEVENIKSEIQKMDVKEEMEDQKKNMDHLRQNQENIERKIRYIIKKVRDFRIYDEREFIWRIDNFSKMADGQARDVILWKYSLKFYLGVYCYEDDIGIICTIMKGELDDELVWPMKHKIILSLINQDTMKVHKCKEYGYDTYRHKSAFDKPTGVSNVFGIGNDRFASLNDIKDSPGVLFQDSLLISLVIDNK